MAHPAATPVPDRIGNYDIQCQLAAGAMGVVYKAYDANLQRSVALKFLNGYAAFSDADRQHLLREARAASALDHKNIAAIHAIEHTGDGRLCIVMAFYEGESLAERMRNAPLSRAESLDTIRQVAQGLAHAGAADDSDSADRHLSLPKGVSTAEVRGTQRPRASGLP